ncbi:folylpolyglutamate synthase/dihydrofolate synthase family protein [Solibacillus sp. CAU 1738]|uniref:bifunctional folylpolyglutamate synthase/dihydrofolate synthase n=1 Tax=Solibacillus sp. CAU 1738 TaxID=3140363 RepID=UPI003260BA92
MFQSMEECTQFIFGLKASMYKGEPLESAKKILNALGNPECNTKFIHFAGSNGKGSTLNATREILMAHGLTVGAFTSPHLERANERVTINKTEITDEQFLRYANNVALIVQDQLDGKFPSFFEMVTIIALQHFAHEKVDIALMETGIGGRLDSTNVITPEVSVITTISLEHTDMLGNTYAEIAYEKAGIIKEGKPAVIGVKNLEALQVIKEVAHEKDSELYILSEEIFVETLVNGQFNYNDGAEIKNLELAMEGAHQMDNAALAMKAAALILGELDEKKLRLALKQAKWQGRFERFGEQIILDGAHNSEGTAALLETLAQVEPNKSYTFVYAALQDKDHGLSIAMMDKAAKKMIFTEIDLPRAAKAEQLFEQSNHKEKRAIRNWQSFILEKYETQKEDELLIITGSLYFIGEVRTFLQKRGVK